MMRKTMARRRAGNPAHAAIARVRAWSPALRRSAGRVHEACRAHPRWALAAVSLMALGLVLSLGGTDRSGPDGALAEREILLPPTVRDLAFGHAQLPPESSEPSESQDRPAIGADRAPEAHARDWTLVEVRSGQTLERIFRNFNLSARLLHQVVNLDENTRGLARIRPGDQFGFEFDSDGNLLALRADLDEESWLIVEQDENGLSSRTKPRALETRVVEASGIISSSLFNAAKDSGLSDNMTMRLANIFGWDIDFALDIRSGDRFALVYEEIWRDGERLRDGAILAARFVNQGEAFEAIRFDAGEGPDYFAPDGRPMRQAFLRAPLNFTRVTSNFNPRRFHPITRQMRPHNGTDYGAPTGTPVWAAGDGRVIRSAYNNANGNYIFVQHGNNIVTRYLHLSRRDVRQGDRVRQGQTIGAVGATGMATGPHLHYEFLVNGVHRNPRTVDLPPADPLPPDLMDDFRRTGTPLLAQLDALQGPTMLLAQRDEADCGDDDPGC
ncbi:MAG: peptidase M23 [Wenzhouxiangella sp.]|nr:MAG: peptidase M23 [Wenzhouxiangella sp.]